MREIDADVLKECISSGGDIVIEKNILECDSIHELLVYLLAKVEKTVIGIIDKQPTVDRETAEWNYDPDGMDWGIGCWKCSKCGCKNDNLGINKEINPMMFAGSKYCPHCGVRMVKPKNENAK